MEQPSVMAPAVAPPIAVRTVIAGLMLTIFLAALDQTIVSVALPRMANQLQGFHLLAWVVSGYLVASTVVTPIYGRLSDLYGRRRMLSVAIAIFLLASAACALATSMPMLVAARVLQGVGGGGLLSMAQAAIADVVAPRERGRYQAYISGTYALANVVGPVVGGLFTEYLGWPWIFWINLPLGAAALLVSRRALAALPVPGERRAIDYPGALLLIAGLTALLVAITRVGDGHAWNGQVNLELFGAAALTLTVFLWHERRVADPILPLDMFEGRVFQFCSAIVFIAFGQVVALTILIPLRLQIVLGVSADAAALRLMPLSMLVPCGAYTAGRMMTRTGRTRPIQLAGASLAMIGIGGLALSDPGQVWATAAIMAVAGFGIGLQLPTSLVAIQNSVPSEEIGSATAATSFFRSLGGAIAIAVVSTILLASLDGAAPQGGVRGAEAMRDLMGGLAQEAATGVALRAAASHAFATIFFLLSALCLVSLFAVRYLPDARLRGKGNG